jgi:hypothetical protein
MEHNFNPNKGDYKYILEEEQRKENGESLFEPEAPKNNKSIFERLRNFILLLLFKRSNSQRKVKVTLPLFIQLFC